MRQHRHTDVCRGAEDAANEDSTQIWNRNQQTDFT